MARPILDLVSTGQPEWGPWMRTKKKESNNKCVKIETGLETGVSKDCTESQREWIEIHLTIQFFFLLSMELLIIQP